MASELATRIISTLGLHTPTVARGPEKDAAAPTAPAAPTRQVSAKSGESLQRQEQTREQAQKPDLQDTVTRLNEYAQSINRQLQFSIDDRSGRPVIKVLDLQTDKVIRQIPSDDVLALARQMHELGKGSLFEQKV